MKKEKDSQFSRVERVLKEREYELERLKVDNRRLEDDVKHLTIKLSGQEKSYQEEYDRKFEELKALYTDQIDKQKKIF